MSYLSQRDPRWANITVGTGPLTIGQIGCTITVLAMLLNTTPDVVNERLKAVNGFLDGNKVIWAKVAEAFPGVTVRRVWSYNNDDVLANTPCLVQVDGAPIGGTIHFVEYIGNHQLADPWDGQVKPTSTYNAQSYAVVKVSSTVTQSVTDSQIQDQLNAQIQATNSCQTQLKTATEQNAQMQQQITQLQTQVNEIKSKYDEDERSIIDLKSQLEALNKEDKDYAQKAYNAEHLAEDRGNLIHALADGASVTYDANKEDDVTEQILNEMHKMKQLQSAPPLVNTGNTVVNSVVSSFPVNQKQRSFLSQLVGLFFVSA